MVVCPLCHQCLEEGQSLELHYFLCSGRSEKKGETVDQMDKSLVGVRLRWTKIEPGVDRIVHLITNLAGPIALHWSDSESLYESALIKVPVGKYKCQLAVGVDIIPIDEFDITENSDTVYVIPTEEEEEEIPEEIEGDSGNDIIDDDDDPVADLLASASIAGSNDLSKEEYHGTSWEQYPGITGDNLSPEGRKKLPTKSSMTELSPLYKELLQHQVLHGEPSWVPKGDDESPTTSDHELDELMTRTSTEEGPPPNLTSEPANPEQRHLKSPLPIRPISNQDQHHHDTSLVTRAEGTEERGPGTEEDVRRRDDHQGSKSSAASSSTYSGYNSEHSSARQSPDLLSDGSDGLQEQSLEEAITRDSPEIQELPQPYDGTFLTSDKTEDVPSRNDPRDEEGTRRDLLGITRDVTPSSLVHSQREKKSSYPIPSGSTTNQSPTRASPHSENQGGSVPGSRGSPTAFVHSMDRIPSSGGAQDSMYPSFTSLPDPGILQGSLRSIDEGHQSPPASERNSSPLASSPAGSTHSSAPKPSAEDVRSSSPLEHRTPISSPSTSLHCSSRSSRGQSLVASVSSLPGQGTTHGITNAIATTRSPAESIHSSLASVHSLSPRGQSPIPSAGFLPGRGTTSPAAISSLHSSTRSTSRGLNPLGFPIRLSSADLPSSDIPKKGEHDVLSRHSRESPTYSFEKKESPRYPASGSRVDPLRDSFSRELLGSLSPRFSDHLRVSPALSHGSREAHGISLGSLDNIWDHRTMSNFRPFGEQRPRSLERVRDDVHRRPEGKEDMMIQRQISPSSPSAFAPMNGERARFDVNHNEERKAILREQERFQEKQTQFEAEIRRLRELNEDLKQQLLSVEAAAALSERDNVKSLGLEATVASLKDTVKEKDEEIVRLGKRCEELEIINQKMKDEQESLKTVNKLTFEDFNKENLDLRVKIHDMQRKSHGSPMKASSNADEILNKMLRKQVVDLEADKKELKQKYNKIKLELDQAKAEKALSDSRLKRARSETDLSETFNRYTTYSKLEPDKDICDQSWTKTSSGLGSSHSWSDNYLTNGLTSGLSCDAYSSRRGDHVTDKPPYSTSRRFHCSMDDDIKSISDTRDMDFDNDTRHALDRHRTLSSESSNSSLLEYEYGANIRLPYQPSAYSSRDTRVELRETGRGRRERPHTFHAGTTVLNSDRQPANGDINHDRSHSYGSTSRILDSETSSRPMEYVSKFRPRDYESLLTRYKASSTVTTPYSTTTGYPRASSRPFTPASSKEIELGMRVMVTRNSGGCGYGIVKYVGTLPGKEGPYIGVELDSVDGRHDGSFQGQRFFKCKPNRGLFVRQSKVLMCYPK